MSNAPNPIDIEVGSKIKAQRRMRGMSQGTLAGTLGISFQQVQKYEKGDNRVSASRLAAIATIFEMPVSYFFEGPASEALGDPDHTAGELVRFIETKEGRDLNLAFAQITSHSLRKRIVSVIKAIAEPEPSDFR
ncbi:helix-turn-helix transcriptional regulator [Rhizobium sp. 1399]|uniref:helix-turn-helix domain-containing protein n=1 Tax=Rhizobium sp. 1399 TaxID=2817758 RepID=UPI002854FB94|nr:helix-turn-helix transcriptional regulator [Rhizobium sp. 1399]MDR6671229.1 transcriptional regulator with XRE-family HTH domain [Rhizobium sp. 1399]